MECIPYLTVLDHRQWVIVSRTAITWPGAGGIEERHHIGAAWAEPGGARALRREEAFRRAYEHTIR